MLKTKASLAAALQELAARGFSPAGYRGRWRLFRGHLQGPQGPLAVLFGIFDWDFVEYPLILVVDELKKFPALRPHLGRDGGLCYFSSGTAILDRYDPATAIAQCLVQAQAVLTKILVDRNYVVEDIQNEFLIHWERALPPPFHVHMGSVKRGAVLAPFHFEEGSRRAIITDDRSAAEALARTIGWGASAATANRCWLFRTDKLPPIPARFPQTVRELFDWLRAWDGGLYKQVQQRLATPEAYEFVLLPMAVHTPVGWIGFGFAPGVGATDHSSAAAAKQYLHSRGASRSVDRLAISDISPEFVHSRNLTFPDLTNKQITVVGCGAIGSQLAPALVRLGAGQGPQGLLRVVDEELLEAENLGRHYLGYNHLGDFKAAALREELLRQFPLARIESVPRSVQDVSPLFHGELLIDATGAEAVSEFLNAKWLAHGRPLPVLYIWIKGNGECVQSLWTDLPQYACFRCLRLSDAEMHRKERFPVLKASVHRKVLGCHAFTPYAVSAPMHAAALAADVVCDWLQGRVTPRLRTRVRENVDVHAVANADPGALPDCPACLNS